MSWREWGESQPLRTALKLAMDICRAEFRQTPGWGCSCLARLEGFPFLDQAGENWFRIVFLAPLSFENRPWSDFRCHERVRVNRHLHHATTALICFYSFLLLFLTKNYSNLNQYHNWHSHYWNHKSQLSLLGSFGPQNPNIRNLSAQKYDMKVSIHPTTLPLLLLFPSRMVVIENRVLAWSHISRFHVRIPAMSGIMEPPQMI